MKRSSIVNRSKAQAYVLFIFLVIAFFIVPGSRVWADDDSPQDVMIVPLTEFRNSSLSEIAFLTMPTAIMINEGCPGADPPEFERRALPAEDAWICISAQHPGEIYWAIGNDALYVNSAANPMEWARWRPTIATTGRYMVEVSIPSYNSNIPKTHNARYKIHHASGDTWKTVNQEATAGSWVSLGTYVFNAGTAGYVYIESYTGESTTHLIAADAVRLTLINQPPVTPLQISPTNGGEVGNATVTLQVQDQGDPDNAPNDYRQFKYYIENASGTWNQTTGWITSTSLEVTLPAEGVYQWKARAYDGDLTSSWTGMWTFGYNEPVLFGSLQGRVTDASTGNGISNARVTLGRHIRYTDSDGNYQFDNVLIATYPFAVSKDGYKSHTSNVTIEEGTKTKNVALIARLTGLTLPINTSVNFYVDLDRRMGWIRDWQHPTSIRGGAVLGWTYDQHNGTDYHGALNQTPVVAAAPGYVVEVYDASPDYNRSLRGNNVVMLHTINGQTIYANYYHLERGTIPANIKAALNKNILIPRGTLLGKVGMSGNTTGPHLHFETGSCHGCAGFCPYNNHLWASRVLQNHPTVNQLWATTAITDDNIAPTANFTVTPPFTLPTHILTFDASVSQDPDGEIVQYLWDLGDGNEIQGQIITYTYSTTGTYYVSLLTVDDAGGATLSAVQAVIISNLAANPGLDSIPPEGIAVFPGNGYTNSLTVTLGLTLTTAEDWGDIMMRFSLDNVSYSSWEPFTEQKTVFLNEEEGAHYVFVQYADGTGNQSYPMAAVIFRDTTPPLVTLGDPISDTLAPGVISFPWDILDVSAHGDDGVALVEYMLVGYDTSWQITTQEAIPVYTNLVDGEYTFFVRATDWAGNQTVVYREYTHVEIQYTTYLPLVIRND